MRRIGIIPKLDSAFKYEETDLAPIHFYFINNEKGELKNAIINLEKIQNKKITVHITY